jgi:uncharacterized protein (DUF934 family)
MIMTRQIILNGALADNSWHLIAADAEAALGDGAIVRLATWLAIRDSASIAGKRIGVWLAPADDPAELAEDVASLPLIAVQFPAFTDGRGYSIGRLLRERHGYHGELRAFGDVGRDHLFNLARCGFNAFEIKDSQDPAQALAGLKDFGEGYQSSVERPVPLYRRRAHTTADSWAAISSPS